MPVSELKTPDKIARANLERLWSEIAVPNRITKTMLAKKAGVSNGSITKVFNGTNPISYQVGKAASELLDVPISRISPKWADEQTVTYEETPKIPHFKSFADFWLYLQKEIVDYELIPCNAAQERYEQLLADGQGQVKERLGFYSILCDRPILLANKGDRLIIENYLDASPATQHKISLWTWDGLGYNLGYFKTVGGKKFLADLEAGNQQERLIPIDDQSHFLGFLRSIQFE